MIHRLLFVLLLACSASALAQTTPASTPEPVSAFVAKAPQMGFNNWNSTRCRDEFNEEMIRGIVDRMVELGLRDAGYRYVNVDDCWANWQRDADGNLFANPVRFPSGMKALADYVHAKGMLFGIYSSAGTATCEPLKPNRGFPGGLDHEARDAAYYASIGVDHLKYDNCNNQGLDARKRYTDMAQALRATGRPILYSVCEWGENQPWLWAGEEPVGATSWRTTYDIADSYRSMLKLFRQNVVLDRYARPGHWNDPDMLQVGNGGMTHAEYRSHFSLWAMMAALLIGTDLRTISQADLEILLNKDLIAVNQDPLGVQARRIRYRDGVHVLHKPLHDGSIAVALFNEGRRERQVQVGADELGLQADTRYVLRDLWQHDEREGDGNLDVSIAAHATVVYRIRAR